LLPTIEFGPEVVRSPEESLSREWLETNGIGGFASSTIWGMNTRRYHGLLVAAVRPPVGRMLMLSKFEETATVDQRRFELSTNRYPGVLHPRGFESLVAFRLDPFPVFCFQVGGVRIEKSVFVVHGENTTVVEYCLQDGGGCELEIRPLVAFRDYHTLTHENGMLRGDLIQTADCVGFQPYEGIPTLYFAHAGAAIEKGGFWYRNLEYDAERERGLDFSEDLYNPFVMRLELSPGSARAIVATTQNRPVPGAAALRRAELDRRSEVLSKAPGRSALAVTLTAAADQYIVDRGDGKTIIAGYHWFSDWGRDTMIALPGITLVTGRHDAARAILAEFARHIDQGMLPNRFPDAGEPVEYNSVDAALWFFEATHAYLTYTHDEAFVTKELYPRLREIVEWNLAGTRFGIKVEEDGLLHTGEAGTQLTWMDAKVNGRAVTPRVGKPVEVQALWYNALSILSELARIASDGRVESALSERAERARTSFNRLFWNTESQCLYDVVNRDTHDTSIRPNQVLALGLAYPIVDRERGACILKIVEKQLLTPMGLRTLAPQDPAYQPVYAGGVASRDSAYHQGTVWPWLMGRFLKAYRWANGDSTETRDRIRGWIGKFEDHLMEAGLGHVSEVAGGSAPYCPAGCIAQAWSVGELLRAIVEDAPN
jgi:predicted glycogen debranching enzyme